MSSARHMGQALGTDNPGRIYGENTVETPVDERGGRGGSAVAFDLGVRELNPGSPLPLPLLLT